MKTFLSCVAVFSLAFSGVSFAHEHGNEPKKVEEKTNTTKAGHEHNKKGHEHKGHEHKKMEKEEATK